MTALDYMNGSKSIDINRKNRGGMPLCVKKMFEETDAKAASAKQA